MLAKLLIPTYQQMLRGLASWLTKAEEQTGDANPLLTARLAPDMFPLSTQIRFACVQAYEGVYRLQHDAEPVGLEDLLNEGRNGGTHPGTLSDALARIDETLSFLDGMNAEAMDRGADKPLALELPMGLAFDMSGFEYARDWALPQFYFHIMTAYAILRHNGIELGKADYVGHAFQYLRPGTAPGN